LKLQWCRNILRNGDAVYEEVKRLLELENKLNR
jgi:hypothetical protein